MPVGIIGGNAINISIVSKTIDPQSVAPQTGVEQFFTLDNARPGDYIDVSPTQFTPGLMFGPCRVTAQSTVSMTITNITTLTIDSPAQSFRFLVVRPESGQIVKSIISD